MDQEGVESEVIDKQDNHSHSFSLFWSLGVTERSATSRSAIKVNFSVKPLKQEHSMADGSADVPPLDIDPAGLSPPSSDGMTTGVATPAVRRASRRTEYRFQYGGPFSRSAVDRADEMEDTAMETVSQASATYSDMRVRNAPALPAAPTYSGATMQERREFMRQYETYCHALSAFETTGVRVFRVPTGRSTRWRGPGHGHDAIASDDTTQGTSATTHQACCYHRMGPATAARASARDSVRLGGDAQGRV